MEYTRLSLTVIIMLLFSFSGAAVDAADDYSSTYRSPDVPAQMSPSLSASPGPDQPLNIIMPFILEDAALCLRNRGYSILALAMRVRSPALLGLQSLTIFTLSDDSVFLKDGQDFVNNVRYHVVPNRRLLMADLNHLPAGTILHTLLHGQSLVVTDTKPFSINHVGIKTPDAFTNKWIAVHEIGRPLLISSHPHHQMQMQGTHTVDQDASVIVN